MMKFPFVRRAALEAERKTSRDLVRETVQLGNDLAVARHNAIETAHSVVRTQEKVNTAQALGAEKQREIASLRAQLAEKEQQLHAERTAAREERHRLMDWIAKGVSNGVAIFAENPLPVVAEEAPTPHVKPGSERVPSDVEEAIAAVGRRPRAIVNHITHKKDVDFTAAMAGAGVKRIFAEDRATAEAEAVVISEEKSA